MHLLFGSQTGQAKSIADGIYSVAIEKEISCKVACFDSLQSLCEIDVAFVVMSTTGDGDIPDSCLKFFRKLRKEPNGCLSKLKFGMLALGDTNYTNFCGGGKAVDALLLSKGAIHIFDTILADDATGQEDDVERFTTKIWDYVSSHKAENEQNGFVSGVERVKINETRNTEDAILSLFDQSFSYSCGETRPSKNENAFVIPNDLKLPAKAKTFLALKFYQLPSQPQGDNVYFGMASEIKFLKLSKITRLSGDESSKTSLLIEVEGTFDYQPGDSFSTVLPNDSSIVNLLLNRLKVAHLADVPVERSVLTGSSKSDSSCNFIPRISTLRYIFSNCVDIASMPFKRVFFRLLADYCFNDDEFRQLLRISSRQGAEEYNQLREKMLTLLDVLNMFPSCDPPVERLLENLPILLPRPYSFASSPLDDDGKFSFVFNVVNIPEDETRLARKGVATGWFEKHMEDVNHEVREIRIPAFLRSNTSFRMPDDPRIPLILIGPGTGVAPFVGFLRHRRQLKKKDSSIVFGSVHLLFGCRTESNDFLFKDELKQFEKDGFLTELLCCFSREENSKFKYVQDTLRADAKKFGGLLFEKNAEVYICGDALNMAKDVNEALISVIEESQGLSNIEARSVMVRLRSEPKRVKEDVWT